MLDDAVVTGAVASVPPKEGRDGDEGGDGPHSAYHDIGATGCPLVGVPHGVGDGTVAVEGNGTQVEDGAGTAGHVQAQPRLADSLPQRPLPHHNVHDGERHHQDGHQEVGGGQRADEIVGGNVQLLGGADGGHDAPVQEDDSDTVIHVFFFTTVYEMPSQL
ncbi:hypothetical protein JZ751_002502 [Albula glossodonta]|uniref:Uncharacterized protein n=1 Tax=Albula glossodonta TaxID=121402 RepID=A0A8T2N717_9TELE|nr:hypothetical protein JZ751_002502 [Albula glossodonta]